MKNRGGKAFLGQGKSMGKKKHMGEEGLEKGGNKSQRTGNKGKIMGHQKKYCLSARHRSKEKQGKR